MAEDLKKLIIKTYNELDKNKFSYALLVYLTRKNNMNNPKFITVYIKTHKQFINITKLYWLPIYFRGNFFRMPNSP